MRRQCSRPNDGSARFPKSQDAEGGMGLRIMRYRAELIGATLRLGSTAGAAKRS